MPRPEPVPSPPEVPTQHSELAPQLLKRLEFNVVRRLDGFLFGNYKGLFYGPSLDLAEVREYQPGDEVRRIDWNVTARTGTVHIRQYREEREILAWLIVDLSPSMAFGTRRKLKRELAVEFAGLAALVISRGGNKVGSVGLAKDHTSIVPLGSGRQKALAIVQSLVPDQARAPGMVYSDSIADLAGALEYAGRTLGRRALVFVVSDFSGPASDEDLPWRRALLRLSMKHDVVAVRVSDPAERTLPNVGDLRLRDPETGHELWLDTSDPKVRAAHAQLWAKQEAKVQRTLRAARVDTLELSTDQDLIGPVLNFVLRRRGRRA